MKILTKWLIGVGVYVVGTIIINAVDDVIEHKKWDRIMKEEYKAVKTDE